jgi:hypothetical protein
MTRLREVSLELLLMHCCLDDPRRHRAAPRACAVVAVVCLFAALVPPAAATTLVVLVSRRAIVVGADSLRTLAGGGTESVCKIHDRDGVVFAFAGAVSSDRFDATTIAGRELAGSGDLAHKARRIADALQSGLVEHFKTRRIEGTRRELVEGQRGRPVTGFVAALVDGKPQGFLVLVLADGGANGVTLTTKVDPLDTLGPDQAIFLSSQHQEVIQAANRSLGAKARASMEHLVIAARELVNLDLRLEAEQSPTQRRSGPPAAIAVLDRSGFRFTDPGVCAPVAPQPERSPAAR